MSDNVLNVEMYKALGISDKVYDFGEKILKDLELIVFSSLIDPLKALIKLLQEDR